MILENRTTLGQTVYAHVEEICNAYGAHGLKVDTNGEIQVLVLQPEGGTQWEDIIDLPLVQTQPKAVRAKRS